jgi:hypothetical protein
VLSYQFSNPGGGVLFEIHEFRARVGGYLFRDGWGLKGVKGYGRLDSWVVIRTSVSLIGEVFKAPGDLVSKCGSCS